jgi:copper oxidase (laccase) domain-containing protein
MRFFAAAPRSGRFLFDLAGYIAHRLARAGIATVEVMQGDTVEQAERFFSYRRACLRGERAYGRGLSAIALEE